MHFVTTESEFARLLQADRAIVFVDSAWSGQARLSAAVINEWEQTCSVWGVDCPVHCVKSDEAPSVASWMKTQGAKLGGEGGYGSLIWLRSGVIVDYEPYVLGAGLREITRRTRSVLGEKKDSDSPLSKMWDQDLDG